MEKTDEQIERERAAVAAMSNAKSNMTAALERIATLERGLTVAKSNIATLKNYIAAGAYEYPINGRSRTCHDIADEAIAAIVKIVPA